jgi:hypothetical protein
VEREQHPDQVVQLLRVVGMAVAQVVHQTTHTFVVAVVVHLIFELQKETGTTRQVCCLV